MSSTKFVFFGPIGKTRWPPWPLIGWDIFDFFSEIAERNSTKLDRKQTLNVLYQVCVFQADLKSRWPPWPLIGWEIFDFSDDTAKRNSKKLDRKQDLSPLPSLCFSGWSEKQDGRPSLWLAETFSTSSLKPLNGIQQNLTGKKIPMSSTKFVFFGPMGKNKMASLASDWLRHFQLLLWNRSMEFNKTWQEARSQRLLPKLCFLGCTEKQDGRPSLWLAEAFSTSSLKRLNRIRRNLTGSKISTSFTKSVFFGPIGKKKDGRHGPWLAETFLSSPLKLLNGIQRNLTGSKISTSSTKLCFSVWWVNKNYCPGPSVKKVAHCTQVHDN